jgi:hypothetical protein
MLFHQIAFCQLAISSTCHFANLTLHPRAVLSTCHSANLIIFSFSQLAIVSHCYFVTLKFIHFAFLSTAHLAHLPFHQLVVSSMCHFSARSVINLSFQQLVIFVVDAKWISRIGFQESIL